MDAVRMTPTIAGKRGVIPPPNVDLAARYQVIDDSVTPPRWKTLHEGYATLKTAQAVIKAHKLPGIWMLDGTGDRQYIAKR
jgi:hypothetical protein